MNRTNKLKWFMIAVIILVIVAHMTDAQRRGGGGGRRRKTGSKKKGKMGINMYKTKASKEYYDNVNASKITYWSHFESEYVLGRKIVFMCTAEGYPVPHFTWYKDGIELYAHSFFQVHEWKLAENKIKSKMEIDPATQKDAGYYECQADNQYAVDTKGFRTDYTIIFD